ncbi:hypothetical protein X975_13486, partial [Stegodyphus mimosarum]
MHYCFELDYLKENPIGNFILGGDFNVASSLWGSPYENCRSLPLLDFIDSQNLILLYKSDASPTFITNAKI